MKIVAIAFLAGAVSYPPPSSDDASHAVARRIAEERYGGDVTAFGGSFPADVRLERCSGDDARAVETDHGAWQVFSGYACVMSVSIESSPDYKVEGFFHHDGLGWYYYGPMRPSLVVEPETFDQYRKGSTMTAKPGSILYNRGSGEMKNPYDRILNWSDAFLEPAGQPWRADIYSIDE